MTLLPTLTKISDIPYRPLPAYVPPSVYYEGGVLEFLQRGGQTILSMYTWLDTSDSPRSEPLSNVLPYSIDGIIPAGALIFLKRGGQSALTSTLALVTRLADLVTTKLVSKCWVWKDGMWREAVMARVG
jgi:hypothetical protein